VAVIGAEEREQGTVNIKNMMTGEQMRVPRGDVAERVSAMVDDRRDNASSSDRGVRRN
jgi:histidyl-tRNA synthetase